ncbi:MAG: ABC transporter ATP-binding protein [Aerococcaceae bacterium]|nr:ABC transporter ATP-binding protein [Aerococcaceae bacterium]
MIKFENIQISYSDFIAVDNLNLEIKEGEFFTFLGPSGCGKSTTLRTLVGFITPSKGEIYVGGQPISHLEPEKREIGIVFQSYALFPTMTVYENIAFGLKVKKVSPDIIKAKVHEVAKKIKISDEQLQRNVSELSGGQQQRVALARALVLEPKILCLDEPLSNLDAKLRVDLRMELKRLQKELGITTLYVTHDQEEALTLSDRIAVFNNGYIEQVGTPSEIYNQSQTEFVCDFIGEINQLSRETMLELIQSEDTGLKYKKSYIRLERIRLEQHHDDDMKATGIIKDAEFTGVFITYTIDLFGKDTVRVIEKNDGTPIRNVGDAIDLYIAPADIMQY